MDFSDLSGALWVLIWAIRWPSGDQITVSKALLASRVTSLRGSSPFAPIIQSSLESGPALNAIRKPSGDVMETPALSRSSRGVPPRMETVHRLAGRPGSKAVASNLVPSGNQALGHQ